MPNKIYILIFKKWKLNSIKMKKKERKHHRQRKKIRTRKRHGMESNGISFFFAFVVVVFQLKKSGKSYDSQTLFRFRDLPTLFSPIKLVN
jgi:hypothetical protein